MLSCLLAFCLALPAQNYRPVKPGAGDDELLKAALAVRPSERQMNWQEME